MRSKIMLRCFYYSVGWPLIAYASAFPEVLMDVQSRFFFKEIRTVVMSLGSKKEKRISRLSLVVIIILFLVIMLHIISLILMYTFEVVIHKFSLSFVCMETYIILQSRNWFNPSFFTYIWKTVIFYQILIGPCAIQFRDFKGD